MTGTQITQRWTIFSALLAIAALLGACQIIVGLHDVDEGPASPIDSGLLDQTTAPVDAGGPVDTCTHAFPPAMSVDAAPGDQLTIWFATQKFYILDQAEGGAPIPLLSATNNAYAGTGFDLDDTCTCAPNPTAHGGAPSCIGSAASKVTCDVLGNGIDNAIALLYGAYKDTLEDPTTIENQTVSAGLGTTLIYLSDYNGTPNDDKVTVAVGSSIGTCNSASDDASPCPVPQWDGGDTWQVYVGDGSDFGVVSANSPIVPSPEILTIDGAYVANGILVFPINKASFLFGETKDGFGAARISQTDGGLWTLSNGVIAARVNTVDIVNLLLTTVAHNPSDCPAATSVASTLLMLACQNRDIMLSKSDDFTNQPCDGISLGVSITGVQANVQPTTIPPPTPFLCAFDASCP